MSRAPHESDASFEVVEVTTSEGLTQHADAWDDLAVRCGRHGTLNATFPWFASFVEYRLEEYGRAWGCLFAYAADELAGVLPFVCRPHALLRGARAWLHVPGDRHTTGGDLLVDTHNEAAASRVSRALAGFAFARRPAPMGLKLGGLVPESPALAALRALSAHVVPEDLAGRSVRLAGTWEAFHAGLGGNLKRNLRKARNRLGKLGTLDVESSTDPTALERFLALESSGWKGADGGAVASRPEALAFYRAFVERLAERGWLQWHFLTLDGAPIAGSLAARWGRQIVLQRVAYDEAHARTSPGQLLLAAALEEWFGEQRFDRMDCLTDQPWHATWCMQATPYSACTLAAPGWVGRLAGDLPSRARQRLKGCGPLRRLVRRLRGES